MAVDRSLNLRPGVLDIADIVDNLLEQVTPIAYDSTDLTFNQDFEQYDSTTQNKISVIKIGNTVYMSGGVKCVTAQTTTPVIMLTLPSVLAPTTRKMFIQTGSGMNRYMLTVSPTGDVYADRYGTTTNTNIPANAFLRIDCSYSIN